MRILGRIFSLVTDTLAAGNVVFMIGSFVFGLGAMVYWQFADPAMRTWKVIPGWTLMLAMLWIMALRPWEGEK